MGEAGDVGGRTRGRRPIQGAHERHEGDVLIDRATCPAEVRKTKAFDRGVAVDITTRAPSGGVRAPLYHAERHCGSREGESGPIGTDEWMHILCEIVGGR